MTRYATGGNARPAPPPVADYDPALTAAVGIALHRSRCGCSLPMHDPATDRFLELLADAGYRVTRR